MPSASGSIRKNTPCSDRFPGFTKGNTAQFGKKPQPGFLAQFKVWKTKEYCMYFSFFKLKKWGKKTAAARRHNCAVLPKVFPKFTHFLQFRDSELYFLLV